MAKNLKKPREYNPMPKQYLDEVFELFDLEMVKKKKLKPRYRFEKQLEKLMPGCKFVDKSIFDFEKESKRVGKLRVELKSRGNSQNWFDIGKYHKLAPDDKQIVLVFLSHKEHIESIKAILLCDFLDLIMNDPNHRLLGWTKLGLRAAGLLKVKFPKFQVKVRANVNSLLQRYKKMFVSLYVQQPEFEFD